MIGCPKLVEFLELICFFLPKFKILIHYGTRFTNTVDRFLETIAIASGMLEIVSGWRM